MRPWVNGSFTKLIRQKTTIEILFFLLFNKINTNKEMIRDGI